MNKEILELIEKAFEDGFMAGRAHENGGLMMRTAWIFWRTLYLDELIACTKAAERTPDPASIGDE